jgi:endonuclease YncB( thermonuclease family)
LLSVAILATALFAPSDAPAQPRSKVYLNGVPTPVYFNDGDTFRVLAGPLKGTSARLMGYNTLESYGRCHQWGTWTRLELAHYATLGTLNARKGVWRCTSEMKKDYYGRILWDCKNLAIDQIRKGLAHAMSITKEQAAPHLLAAQRYAIKHRKGMWANGVPDYILTSVHSKSEGWEAYNRFVSSADGHSEKWLHGLHFDQCQLTCQVVKDFDRSKALAWVEGYEDKTSLFGDYSNEEVVDLLESLATDGKLGSLKDEGERYEIETVFSRPVASGQLSKSGKAIPCMVYVEFKRRYGHSKATCLK